MSKKKSLYSVHPAVKMVESSMLNLQTRTGRSIEEWVEFVKKEGPLSEKERRDWLKNTHGFTTNYAWWVAERADGKGWEDSDPDKYLEAAEKYVEGMFTKKPDLKPIYDRLLELGLSIGGDVRACPCQTIVPLYREHVFAQMKPSTKTRIDLGFALKDTIATGRLIDTGGFAKKDRITHRIPISALEEIDEEVAYWLKKAYDMDAPK